MNWPEPDESAMVILFCVFKRRHYTEAANPHKAQLLQRADLSPLITAYYVGYQECWPCKTATLCKRADNLFVYWKSVPASVSP